MDLSKVLRRLHRAMKRKLLLALEDKMDALFTKYPWKEDIFLDCKNATLSKLQLILDDSTEPGTFRDPQIANALRALDLNVLTNGFLPRNLNDLLHEFNDVYNDCSQPSSDLRRVMNIHWIPSTEPTRKRRYDDAENTPNASKRSRSLM